MCGYGKVDERRVQARRPANTGIRHSIGRLFGSNDDAYCRASMTAKIDVLSRADLQSQRNLHEVERNVQVGGEMIEAAL